MHQSYSEKSVQVTGPHGQKHSLSVQKIGTAKGVLYQISHDGTPVFTTGDRHEAHDFLAGLIPDLKTNPYYRTNRAALDMGYQNVHSGQVVKNQLRAIEREADQLENMLEDGDDLPLWIHTKIATSLDRLTIASQYLTSKLEDTPSQRQNPPSTGWVYGACHACGCAIHECECPEEEICPKCGRTVYECRCPPKNKRPVIKLKSI